jgi:hypothetical protein
MTKHELACVAYVRANTEIRRITRLIGIQISNCREAKAREVGEDPEVCSIPHCLPDYYRNLGIMRDCGWIGCGQVPPIECVFCAETDRLIQLRKDARQTLGAAKRQITILGKASIKQCGGES